MTEKTKTEVPELLVGGMRVLESDYDVLIEAEDQGVYQLKRTEVLCIICVRFTGNIVYIGEKEVSEVEWVELLEGEQAIKKRLPNIYNRLVDPEVKRALWEKLQPLKLWVPVQWDGLEASL